MHIDIIIMVKSVIMGKYVRQQKYMRAVMKNRKSINSGLSANLKYADFILLLASYTKLK